MYRIIFSLLIAISIASCAPKSRFEWGGYENSLYQYYKNPEQRTAYKNSLEKAVVKGEKSGRLAPGLLAELGYLALEDGDTGLAVSYFNREMKAFPESKPFLSGVIQKIEPTAGPDGPPVS